MSDATPPDDSTLSLYDRSPRGAFAALSDETRADWHLRYCPQPGMEPRVWVLLERVEREMRAAGEPTTIHALWVALADRAGRANDPDVSAAAALAGVALGLRAS